MITYDFVQYLPNGQSQAFVLLTSLLFGKKFGFYVSLPVSVAKTKHQIVPAKNTTFLAFWYCMQAVASVRGAVATELDFTVFICTVFVYKSRIFICISVGISVQVVFLLGCG